MPAASVVSRYRRLFSIEEIERSRVLQQLYVVMLFGFLLTFYEWARNADTTVRAAAQGRHECWPFFPGCGDLAFTTPLPQGYSHNLLYMGWLAVILTAAWAVWERRWVLAHGLMVSLFVWKALTHYVLTMALTKNYHYHHLVFAFALLFLPRKLYFLRRLVVLLYLFAASIKLHEGWILGTFFSSLKSGLPFVPDALIPVATNLVIGMLTASPLLLSRDRVLQRVELLMLAGFHLFSGLLVGFTYPVTMLPVLFLLFWDAAPAKALPFDRRLAAGWAFALLLGVGQAVPRFIPGDEKLTLEGAKFGLYMFDANHQCVSTTRAVARSGAVDRKRTESIAAQERCDPWAKLFRIQELCQRSPDVSRVAWTFDHSINGGPFYRLVDTEDACRLTYQTFAHNAWLRLPEEGAAVVGYPVKNVYDPPHNFGRRSGSRRREKMEQ